jgi:hypothetical protein
MQPIPTTSICKNLQHLLFNILHQQRTTTKMRPTLRLAASLAPGSNRTTTLIPPLTLYRRILRAHRHLPANQRVLGDSYVKEEFRRHRDVENPAHIVREISR